MSLSTRMILFVGIAVVALTLLGAAACGRAGASGPSPQTQPTAADNVTVPAQLAVPAGQRLVTTLHVDQGSQVYVCTHGAWSLKEPAAVLKSGTEEVLHTAGPEWISTNDGSAVTGATSAMVPVPGAIPELLLRATAHQGSGVFGAVSYIQRLDTHGGLAPAGACTDGALQAVGYSAVYRFYQPAS